MTPHEHADLSGRPVAADASPASGMNQNDCFQCGEPLEFPDELICNRCAEEILQAQVHEGTP
jgi:hypothetical protein